MCCVKQKRRIYRFENNLKLYERTVKYRADVETVSDVLTAKFCVLWFQELILVASNDTEN